MNAAKAQADQLSLQMQAERTQAAAENEARQRRLRSVLATQNAIFGGSNVDMTTGSPVTIAQDSVAQTALQQNQAMLSSSVRQSMYGMQSSDILSAGRYGLIGGVLNGAQSVANAGISAAKIGSVPRI